MASGVEQQQHYHPKPPSALALRSPSDKEESLRFRIHGGKEVGLYQAWQFRMFASGAILRVRALDGFSVEVGVDCTYRTVTPAGRNCAIRAIGLRSR